MPPSWYTAGESFIQNVQAYSTPFWDVLFGVGSFLGEEWFYLFFLPLLYWCVNPSLGRWVAYALLLSGYVNSALKHVWNAPRPPEALWRNLVVRPNGPGFPSGHAQISTTVWGVLAWRVRRAWLWALAVVLVGVISFSRIYNGVHYPHDVVGGLVIGALGGVLFTVLGPRVGDAVKDWSVYRVVWAVTGLAVVMVLLHPAQDNRWPAASAIPFVATLWGMSIGFTIERRWIHFEGGGVWWMRILRGVLGLLGVMAVYIGMHVLLPFKEPNGLYMAARAVRYVLVGLSVSWWLPALFKWTGLST